MRRVACLLNHARRPEAIMELTVLVGFCVCVRVHSARPCSQHHRSQHDRVGLIHPDETRLVYSHCRRN